MSGGYSPKDVTSGTQVISGVVTNRVVSQPQFPITNGGSLNLVAKIAVSGVTVVGAITAKLQTAIGSDWQDSKTATISGNGIFYIKINVEATADQGFCPLLAQGRIVVTTTNAGDAVQFDSINVLQEL